MTGIWYDSDPPGIKYQLCNAEDYPEAGISLWSAGSSDAYKMLMYDTLTFDAAESCNVYSYRAVVSQVKIFNNIQFHINIMIIIAYAQYNVDLRCTIKEKKREMT